MREVPLPAVRRLSRVVTWALLVSAGPVLSQPAQPAPRPIFDAHLHYSHDAWDRLPPAAAEALLRQAGLKQAMVSRGSDEGTQKLCAAAPDLVLPVLRPCRTRGETGSWVRDDSLIAHLASRLTQPRYVALAGYHVYGADADLPVVRREVQLAREHQLYLHSHSDADAIERQFRQDPQARILWGHVGFELPDKVREMLRKHRHLWCDLAFRNDHATVDKDGGKVDPGWREAFLALPDRFLVGIDTCTPERWHCVVEHARWSREWLADLPRDVAERIAWRNGEALYTSMRSRLAP